MKLPSGFDIVFLNEEPPVEMDSVNSVTRAFRLITICHCEVFSESSQKPNLTKHLSLRIMFLWHCLGQCSQWQKGAKSCHRGLSALYQHPSVPLRARWPPHLLPMGYTNSPRHSSIPWSADSKQVVDLLLSTGIIDYINELNSSQAGLKWRHSDFFPFSPLCLLSL